MKILEVLLARPSLFFNLAGIRISDFDNLARQTYPLWLESEHNRLSYKGRILELILKFLSKNQRKNHSQKPTKTTIIGIPAFVSASSTPSDA